jgi:hypothetical protein
MPKHNITIHIKHNLICMEGLIKSNRNLTKSYGSNSDRIGPLAGWEALSPPFGLLQ